ncbi:hypothetical protein HN51_017942 [Arachis hypogaea]|uniref:Glycosyltransferase family 92 protein n=1 Tax=Arachis hypogaea TaxID=3818 RepID=A0A445BRP4_ARAHY|nr:glycosyltransferase family 92 protein Os08g0121900-like [Arachis hypogaea]QHO29481.1 UPF0392 protein [Arachis hypogaea]RYR41357.1 hypothetical protein Ahy_A08g037753 [Arachis hypogaea]
MRRRSTRATGTFLLCLLFILLFSIFSLHLSRNAISSSSLHLNLNLDNRHHLLHHSNKRALLNNFDNDGLLPHPIAHRVSSINVSSLSFSVSVSESVLLPDWEILLIVSPNTPLPPLPLDRDDNYHCLFRNNQRSPAKFFAVLPFTNRTTFRCVMPESVRRRRIFSQPNLVASSSYNESPDLSSSPAPELLRWNFFVYESFSTDDDVVLFAKGVNSRQGNDRSPNELRCVFSFGDGIRNTVKTTVTSSVQEVFRCPHPDPLELGLGQGPERITVSLEIIAGNLLVPSVAYYTPRPNKKPNSLHAQPKYQICACTMVYNVAKFLREWVMYHSKVGIDNFLLYDNGSDDDLKKVINELRGEGYNISVLLWIWPKTQEAGFSHSVLYSKSQGMCKWIMYVDVDEFVFSPSWGNIGKGHEKFPSLKSMVPREKHVGQVSVNCLEFGPSSQKVHPLEGVTQGYTCRRKVEQRHKSMVLVDAVNPSLWNVIHHFMVNDKAGFVSIQLGLDKWVVNHYKYQAWDEFKNKFRRRVSAYVVDWRQNVNLNSKDRTPGLGHEAIEPEDWATKFCEVRDERLKSFTQKWFGSFRPNHTHA